MKVEAILNNYQMGSYSYIVMRDMIVKEERIDSYHTKITYDNMTKSQYELLKKVVKNAKIVEE